ncbi:hypothetical protein M0R45_006292 [Rubus argutus]|uniref:Myb-like domain-containing protein n=1 Tax=Rubus argutus TaxID=59490 RepID=A0AAW1YQ44_RUBAR
MEGEERTDLEFEAKEEKKKHEDKGKMDELDTTSSVVEVCGDEMGKVVEGENCYKNGGGTHMNSGEGANKKKKRKRKKEGGDIEMNNVIDEKELVDDMDKSNGNSKEEADITGNLKKGNRILEGDEMSVAAGYEDAAKVNNEAGDMKGKKEKEKRENAGGELVQNIKTNGMEPGVETQSLDGNIVQKDGFALNESEKEKRNGGKNSECKLLDTVAEKLGTESSEVQENIFLENGSNVQSTADESCNRDLETVVVDVGKKRKKKKKAKSEKHANVEDSTRDLEAVNVEDGEKLKKKKAKSEEQVDVEDSTRDLEAVNVEDGEKLKKKKAKSEEQVDVEDSNRDLEAVNEDGEKRKKKKKAKSEEHVNVEDSDRDVEAVDVEHGKLRKKKKAKSEKHVNVEELNRDMEVVNVEDGEKSKKKKAKSKEHVNVEDSSRDLEAVNVEDGEKRKKKKAKSEEHANVEDCDRDMAAVDVEDGKLRKKKANSEKHVNVEDSNRDMEVVNVEDGNKRKKKAKAEKHVNVEDCNRNTEAVIIEDSEKKQNASDEVVLSPSDGPRDEHDLVRGKRFSEEEDKIVREAVLRYIEEQDLGVDGLNMVLHCRSHPKVKKHPEVRNCWKVIGAAIPWRPFKSVYYRAHILFERAEDRAWTPEEYEAVRKFHKDHGADWRTLGDKLGKHRIHVKDAWRRLKLPNHRKGPWSQEEYQTLFDLVNIDLRMKASEEKKTKHGMLRDNICWEAISEKLGTRSNSICSMKWYNQLASPLVNQKLWADIDDYRLLNALNSLQAGCIEDVDWDDLLEHRPGDVCRKRWDQMIKHIDQHAFESFPDQVEVLFKRYPADIIEAIEVYDSKPVVD